MAPGAGAIYKPVVIVDRMAYVSGCVPFEGDGKLFSRGKVSSQVMMDIAKKAAALCAALASKFDALQTPDRTRDFRSLQVADIGSSDLRRQLPLHDRQVGAIAHLHASRAFQRYSQFDRGMGKRRVLRKFSWRGKENRGNDSNRTQPSNRTL